MKAGNTHILFLLTLQPNPRFVKQINYLNDKYKTSVLYFSRNTMVDYSGQIHSSVEQKDLGKIPNGKYLKRVFIFFKSIVKIKKYIKNNNISHIVFDKIDAFIIYYLIRIIFWKQSKIIKIIEVPDLKKINFEKSITAKIYRYFEKKWMNKYIDKLLVTSPEYYNAYYKSFYKKDYFVLENKPLSSNLPDKRYTNKEFNSKILTLGLIGGLNRGKPTKALLDIVSKNNWLCLKVFGLGIDEKIINEYASKFSNIEFNGKFNFFKDAAMIYNEVDVAYIVYDTTNISLNTKLALPNKLYECMYFEIPMIVSKDTYLAKRVLEDKIGVAIDFTNETEMINAFINIRDNYKSLKENFNKISEDKYIADTDYKEFTKFIID
ncbi:MAG: hypothetical protein AB7S50_01685 [Bacteroidales bacterium]